MAFKDELRRLRKQDNLTQEELANKLGISKSTISMYERGEREPDFERLETIADFFNVDMNILTGYIAPNDLVRVVGGWMTSKAAALAAGISEDELSLIYAYRRASLADKQIVDNIIERYLEQEKSHDFDIEKTDSVQMNIDKEVEAYRQQLIDEKRAEDKFSVSQNDTSHSKKMA